MSTQTGDSLSGWLLHLAQRTPGQESDALSDIRFMTVAEVARMMRVSNMTVYRLLHSGELESIRVGSSFRVPEQAVNAYLRAAFVTGQT